MALKFQIENLRGTEHDTGGTDGIIYEHQKGVPYEKGTKLIDAGLQKKSTEITYSQGHSRIIRPSTHIAIFNGHMAEGDVPLMRVPVLEVRLRELFNKHFEKEKRRNVTQKIAYDFDALMLQLEKIQLILDVKTDDNTYFLIPRWYEQIRYALPPSQKNYY